MSSVNPAATAQEAVDGKPRVLIVDDQASNVKLLAAILGDDYRVRVATNGPDALKLAESAPQPDLILLDIMMPDMDGYQVFQRLQSDPATRRIPVIFLTAKVGAEDEERGLAMGAVDFIHKPIAPSVVLARVRTQFADPPLADLSRGQERLAAAGGRVPGERGFPDAGGDDPGHGLPGRIPR